jgi:glycosyltransferase involved in cell wall biosynthesis
LEALASGLPVVTTNVGGIHETIVDGKNGFMCQPFNAEQFSNRILYLLEHPAAAGEMGAQARKTIEEQLDWRIVVKEAMKVYEEVLQGT